jgi:hypothetical protein
LKSRAFRASRREAPTGRASRRPTNIFQVGPQCCSNSTFNQCSLGTPDPPKFDQWSSIVFLLNGISVNVGLSNSEYGRHRSASKFPSQRYGDLSSSSLYISNYGLNICTDSHAFHRLLNPFLTRLSFPVRFFHLGAWKVCFHIEFDPLAYSWCRNFDPGRLSDPKLRGSPSDSQHFSLW